MHKIVFITEHPYYKRDHHRYGMEYMMSRGYDVEIWRLISKRTIDFKASAELYAGENIYEYSIDEIRSRIDNNEGSVFLLTNPRSAVGLDVVSKGKPYIVMITPGREAFASYSGFSPSIISRMLQMLKKGALKSIHNKVKKKVSYGDSKINKERYLKLYDLNPPMLTVTSTRYMAKKVFSEKELSGNVLYIHSEDCDRFIEENRKEHKDNRVIVYCDCSLFNKDYDTALSGVELPSVRYKEEYYAQLEELFKKLESHYGMKVVIAGHPHAIYEKGDFCGREIMMNRLIELVSVAELFIVSISTAITQALLYDVPIMYIANGRLKEDIFFPPNAYDYIRFESESVTGAGFLDLDNEDDMQHPWDFAKKADVDKRSEYISKYVTDSNHNEKTIIEYIDDYLQDNEFMIRK